MRMLTNVRLLLEPEAGFELLRDHASRLRRIAALRNVCASRSAGGATNSPARNVAIASGMPTRTTAHPICNIDAPEARITVYSELATRLRDREQRADQRRDREQLVDTRRQVQRDVQSAR